MIPSLGTFPRLALAFTFLCSCAAFAQSTPAPAPAPPADAPPKADEAIDKRILGVLPNYRTGNLGDDYHPLTARRKFYIGFKDSTDYPVFFVAAAFAGLYQAQDSHPVFGQGVKGYVHRYATSYGDLAIGNAMTESLLPSLLHEDPRYFRVGTGSVKSRLFYAVSRIVVARKDKGGWEFNFSEVVGNAITAEIANAYYPGERKIVDNAQRLGTSLTSDTLAQILKEFWPDIKHRWLKKSKG